jgi:hypothetical protein
LPTQYITSFTKCGQQKSKMKLQESNFTVTVNGKSITVISAELWSTSKKRVIITLSYPIFYGDVVTITYKQGSLVSALGVPVPGFTASVTNKSNAVSVENIGNFELITVSDMFGRKLIEMKPDQSGTTKIDVSKLRKGMYVIVLSDSKKQVEFKVIKL